MIIKIYEPNAHKQSDGKWFIRYTVLYDYSKIDDRFFSAIRYTLNKKIEEYLNLKLDSKLLDFNFGPYYYLPKDDADEVEFILKFPTLNNKEFEIPPI